jgi:hypothetical protein
LAKYFPDVVDVGGIEDDDNPVIDYLPCESPRFDIEIDRDKLEAAVDAGGDIHYPQYEDRISKETAA